MAEQSPDDRSLLEGLNLSFAEAALLCEALRALWISPQFIERTWREVREIVETDGLDQKWGIPAEVLFARVGGLRRPEASAVLRATIRFWARREEPTAKLLSELGFIPSPLRKPE